jgi:hypothetical protein
VGDDGDVPKLLSHGVSFIINVTRFGCALSY